MVEHNLVDADSYLEAHAKIQGIVHDPTENRFESFAAERDGCMVKWCAMCASCIVFLCLIDS